MHCAEVSRNKSVVINGRKYAGHAFGRMQDQGFIPSVVENTIQNNIGLPNKYPGRVNFYDAVNNVYVVIENGEEGLDKTVESLEKMVASLLDEYLGMQDPQISEIAIVGDSTWLICPNCFDAWESMSSNSMVFCPTCEHVCHNPRFH